MSQVAQASTEKQFINSGDVCRRYGGVTQMTLHRWLANPDTNFPRPIRIGKLRLWELAALDAFDASKLEEAAR